MWLETTGLARLPLAVSDNVSRELQVIFVSYLICNSWPSEMGTECLTFATDAEAIRFRSRSSEQRMAFARQRGSSLWPHGCPL